MERFYKKKKEKKKKTGKKKTGKKRQAVSYNKTIGTFFFFI